jgi:large subunit ribosomal protein L24
MAIAKIQTGDKVKVISGSYKGHEGIVKSVQTKMKGKKLQKRVTVSGLKKITKYRRSFTYQGQAYPGSMNQVDRTVDISNVMLVDDKGKATRTSVETSDDGKKFRAYKSTNKKVEKSVVPEDLKLNDNQTTNA